MGSSVSFIAELVQKAHGDTSIEFSSRASLSTQELFSIFAGANQSHASSPAKDSLAVGYQHLD
jgi:hypothetical protein